MRTTLRRRQLLAALVTSGGIATAGCLGSNGSVVGRSDLTAREIQVDLGVVCEETDGPFEFSGGRAPTEIDGAQAIPEATYEDGELPLREESLSLGHERETLREEQMSGGVGHDGIPSIDDPQFARGEDVDIPACERVFGVEIDGDVRAYPQRILVRHEIVNDVVGGEPVAVTYCPLTGTAQGFYRGGVEFGVSGRLVNSNLIMWDRDFDVRWPQISATAIEVGGQRGTDGDHLIGRSLREFRMIWTTWGRWKANHPETLIMTTETGFARNYNSDPYGSYTPVSGHYAVGTSRRPDFPLLAGPDGNEKQVVLGARTSEGAIAFDKLTLLEESVLTGTIGETPVVAVADETLATGYVYENPDESAVTAVDEGYAVDDATARPAKLPLEPIVAFDAMWFAWFGYYPDTERVGI